MAKTLKDQKLEKREPEPEPSLDSPEPEPVHRLWAGKHAGTPPLGGEARADTQQHMGIGATAPSPLLLTSHVLVGGEDLIVSLDTDSRTARLHKYEGSKQPDSRVQRNAAQLRPRTLVEDGEDGLW